jgi:SAM-dependent methyltransferase
MVLQKAALLANRKRWDRLVPFHMRSRMYGVDKFKAGKSSLGPIELEEVGDPRGKSLLHLQCHFGMDTLSWARLGANVTGVDYSREAIRAAVELSKELGVPARFVCSDIYDLPSRLKGKFDIVYTSHGILCWLPDLARWGKIIARYLRPGGTFYILEGHPLAFLLSQDSPKPFLRIRESYFAKDQPARYLVRGSYADGASSLKMEAFEWQHPLSEVVSALAGAGLRIEYLHEFPFDSWHQFSWQVKRKDGYWHPRDRRFSIPLMFSIRATRPA